MPVEVSNNIAPIDKGESLQVIASAMVHPNLANLPVLATLSLEKSSVNLQTSEPFPKQTRQ